MRSAPAAALLLALATATARADTRTYLLVVAENRSLDPEVPALEYADDDAAKNWELFSLYADRASLFAVFDEDTARLHPEAAAGAEVPDRAALLDRLTQYNVEMAADSARGDEPELFILYAGHGDIDASGQGYITLHDAKLTRAELYREIIAPSRARFVHVVVDACKSYYLVKARGKQWSDDRVAAAGDRSDTEVGALLAEEELDRYPRAGVIVATSGDQETHEWSRYRGGILSHELRSALSGAADVNGDGRVEYSEVRAFLAAANARVTNPEVRLETFARPPALDRHRPLVDLARVRGARGVRLLHFSARMTGQFSIEDERGVRYADLNKDVGTAFDVLVPAGRAYYLRRAGNEEAEVGRAGAQQVELAALRWSRLALAARGAVEQSFRQDLYRVPYGRRFYDGFVATSGDLAVDDGGLYLDAEAAAGPPRHRLAVGYLVSGAPAGEAGASHALALGYAYRLGRRFDLGLAAELGHGWGVSSPVGDQALTRLAGLLTFGLALRPEARFGIELEAAAGWQILSGTVEIDDHRLTGTEPNGLRAELAGGLSWRLAGGTVVRLRGGVAADGVYAAAASSTAVHPFGGLALAIWL